MPIPSHTALFALLCAACPAGSLAQRPPPTARVWPDSAWRAIGPAVFGGRVDDIAVVADDPRIIFVGTASGGVFRSRNNGVTWEPVFDAYGTALSIGSVAIAPSDRNVVWVGTGEPNNRQSSTWGDGVYRSLDGGTTWRHMGLHDTQSIGRVVIDPHDPNTVFVAAVGHLWGPNEERGLYRTRDGGTTWRKVLGVDANTGVIDVAIADDGRTLFAATYERRRRAFGFVGGGPGSGLWRSLDGGDSWERLTSGLPAGTTGRIGVAIAKSDPDIVYAVVENADGGVFRSQDRGATWARQDKMNQRPSYYGQIRVDPKNPDRVWLLNTFLYRSIDGGKSFSDDSVVVKVHPDNHALWIDPNQPQHMILGNDGGVYFTYDGAGHWDYINNLPIGQFYDVSVDEREPYWIYGGLQDIGTYTFPSGTFSRGDLTDGQVTFIGYGDGFETAPDPTNPRLVYTNSQNGRAYVVDLLTHEERRITPVASDPKDPYRFTWNTAHLVSPNDPRVYYYGAQRLLKTTDHGTTWQAISPDLTRHEQWKTLALGTGIPLRDSATLSRDDGLSAFGTITTISESPVARGTMYVGTDDGNVQLTTDSGIHWTNVTSRFHLASNPWVTQVVASSHDGRVAYVAFDGHADDDMRPYIFKTTDGGATWRSISGDLPAAGPVKTISEDPRNANLLFAGTEFGLYWSFDGGQHWKFPGGTLPHVMVDRVVVDKRTNDLVLGTYGRGVIILDDIRPLEEIADGADVRLFPARDATERYQYRLQPPLGGRTFAAPNTPVGALVSYFLKDSSAAVRIQIVGPGDSIMRELSGPGTPGMHRVLWDLRTQYAFVPPPQDSGYYGAPSAPYVSAGTYTIKLLAHRKTLTEKVQVRADPRAITTPEALDARQAMMLRIDSLARAFAEAQATLSTIDTEVAAIQLLRKTRPASPPLDSLLSDLTSRLAKLRPKFGTTLGTPIGDAYDLLGGLEGASFTPTAAEQATFDTLSADLRESIAKLNDLSNNLMPRVRASAVGR